MKYGFIIDNRKCIGCHACTVACKSEHDVPVGVNRTWVKQIEKGTFPQTQRVFSVMRCNHCTDAPCVDICPVEALHIREDGIVDFDNQRCIGCKACTQACPYDALYIDPQTNTAAKCNYCAHRIDIGLEPACVNVCPEHAIISGDMEDPQTEISQLLNTQKVMVRKPEKGTQPNVFYINGDEASLSPSATPKGDSYLWNEQKAGVGHFARYAEQKIQNADTGEMANTLAGNTSNGKRQIDAIIEKARRVYDAPHKGTLWGWEVSAYVWTKAISAGAVLVPFIGAALGLVELSASVQWTAIVLGLVFLTATGALLVKDLDQPKRFVYVLLRPQWKSWLVRGGYAISVFGGLLTLWAVALWFEWEIVRQLALWGSGLIAAVVAIYTAFLFAQAKGRDFWQSPMLSVHMLGHAFMAGAATFMLTGLFLNESTEWMNFIQTVLTIGVVVNLLVLLFELTTPHPTADAKATVKMILKGSYRTIFWYGTLILGNLLPLALIFVSGIPMTIPALLVLLGIYLTEHIWVQAPQQIALS